MGYKLAMLLGLTGLLMMLMVDQADSACCRATIRSCSGWFWNRRCTGRCRDGTGGTPYCGRGPCNWFGCNCNGGCRGTKRSVEDPGEARSLLELLGGESAMSGRGFEDDADAKLKGVAEEARDLLELLRGEQENIYREDNAMPLREFGHHDANEDMKLSKEEALMMLKEKGEVDINNLPDDWFESMDKDGDGYIEPEEYDSDMAKGRPPAE
ncbi:PREDICTED: uncharacterized protein LOC109480560 [Branchiostoma belcheri]|uniref:Uncharacterized protein LOC109480560 n=1 Tax=Branchiostoma belcheri TaxID=7741 RepID=A0A6P5A560_BRABE|nr:PREDICTED: uncharacterized protein LOC109480560 [Branchiostoma belcheri]